MSDPTDDKTYEGLGLKDFLRHFVKQVDDQRSEIENINTIGFKPLYDPAFPETMPRPKEYANRRERRQAELKQRKAAKKKK